MSTTQDDIWKLKPEEIQKKFRTSVTVLLECGEKIEYSMPGIANGLGIVNQHDGKPEDNEFISLYISDWREHKTVRRRDVKSIHTKVTEPTDAFNDLGTENQ